MEIRTDRHALIEVERSQHMLQNNSCLVEYGVAQVVCGKVFKVLVSNLGEKPKTLLKEQTVANAKPNPTSMQESYISHGELFGIISKDTPTGGEKSSSYRKRNIDGCDIGTIYKHLTDMHEAHIGSDEPPTTVGAINFNCRLKASLNDTHHAEEAWN